MVRRPDSLEDAKAMREAALDSFGSIKMLAIGSGYNKAGFIHELEYQDWQDVMDANVRGAWFMAKAVGSYWIEQDIKGKTLLMSSVRGRHGNISGYTGYCASKGGVVGLTQSVALDLAKYNIRCNAISPGAIDTDFYNNEFLKNNTNDDLESGKKYMESVIPFGRYGSAEDVANVALFLASELSGYVTGQNIIVDGGFSSQ